MADKCELLELLAVSYYNCDLRMIMFLTIGVCNTSRVSVVSINDCTVAAVTQGNSWHDASNVLSKYTTPTSWHSRPKLCMSFLRYCSCQDTCTNYVRSPILIYLNSTVVEHI